MPTDLVEAARDLVAGPISAFIHIRLPWLRPALGGCLLLAAPISFDDFVRSPGRPAAIGAIAAQ